VDTLHVVKEVVATGEAMSRQSTLAVLEMTEVGPGTVTVHAVCLTLMAEQACSGRELNADASLFVAAEWLQVRVDVLVVVALQRCRLVGAARLALLRAVVLAVLVRTLLVEDVAASDLGALLLELSLGCVSRRLDILVAVQRLWRKRGRSALFCVVPLIDVLCLLRIDSLRELNASCADGRSNKGVEASIVGRDSPRGLLCGVGG
jgi:hypothetical protein